MSTMNMDANAVDKAEGAEQEAPQKPILSLKVSQDKQEVELELIRPPTEEILELAFEDVIQAIADIRVVYGVDGNIIRTLCKTPRYNVPFTVARGKKAEVGADGSLHYLIETHRDLSPKLREDGTVDYRDIGYTQNVEKDQVLCEITLAQKGDDGVDVYGNVLPGVYGKEPPNIAGKNTAYNEDKTKLIALVSGDVAVNKGVVSVSELLKINGNVDNSTGDIDFVGDIQISGDIVSGFKVNSRGNITVRGTVEGASLQAEGDIVINEGINGMNRGSIIAGGNIRCRYIQGVYVKSGGNIYADSIMYCNAECGGDMELKGKRGVLIGGRTSITGALIATTIGTDSHVTTQVQMCSTDNLQKELIELKKQAEQTDAELLKLEQVVNRYNDLKSKGIVRPELEAAIAAVGPSSEKLKASRAITLERIEKIEQEQIDASRSGSSYIECKGRIHSGVMLSFGPVNMLVNQSFVFSRVSLGGEEILITPLGGGSGR